MEAEETEKEEEMGAVKLPSLAGVKLADAPILFFVLTHKAFRREFEELHSLAIKAAQGGSYDQEVVDELRRRFEFLYLVYKYHCAAEDELIFLVLDSKVKNVTSTYALEHKPIDDDFNSVLHSLDLFRQENEDISNLFQKLIFSIGTIQDVIYQHTLKEEEQVFPLLIQHLSAKEQAKLVWQYMSSVPLILVEDILSWMASFLPPDEKLDLQHCIEVIVPKEDLLQEVFVSWMNIKKQSSLGPSTLHGKGAQFFGGETSFKDILKIHCGGFNFGEDQESNEAYLVNKSTRPNPIDGIHIWNIAIGRGFSKVLEDLYQIRSSKNLSNLSSVVIQLQFFLDVLIFYSNILNRIYYPMKNELHNNGVSLSSKKLVDGSEIARLENLLYSVLQGGSHLSNLLEGLCKEVELLLLQISKILIFVETEVFPVLAKNCSHDMQLWLLYIALQTMPLGLLKCSVLWFSATLSEDQFKAILDTMKVDSPMIEKYFSSLLHEWVRTCYLGKASMEKFTKDLQENFSPRSHFLSEELKADVGISKSKMEMQAMNTIELEPNSALSTMGGLCNPSSSVSHTTEELEVSCSGKINLRLFFPQIWRKTFSFPKDPAKYDTGDSLLALELTPMDHILLYHKALIKDLRYIVSQSAKLAEDVQLVPDFQSRFQRLQFLYSIHSDIEDEVVFPSLESKGQLRNISCSYSIDHKMESEQFKKVTLILNKLYSIHADLDIKDFGHRRIRYIELCLELQETCLSLQRIISEHINREDIELGNLFREHFSVLEQEKIVGQILGRTGAECLQEIIPWLMSSLTQDEQCGMMSLWRKVTKSTNFAEWLGEWWEGVKSDEVARVEEGSIFPPSLAADTLEVHPKYLWKVDTNFEGNWQEKGLRLSEKQFVGHDFEQSRSLSLNKRQHPKGNLNDHHQQGSAKLNNGPNERYLKENVDCTDQADEGSQHLSFSQEEQLSTLDQKELETAIRRVSRDSTLDSETKSHVIQGLLMSRWIMTKQRSDMVNAVANGKEDVGQCPSYQDTLKSKFGCKHYKRNCKLLIVCCNKLYACIRCHDELTDHSTDRKLITKMMCMKCLMIQPIGPKCTNLACNNFSMARYYCRICKLFDDERQIYHCPYCNLCRVGKGLGIDYFHCMNCNACLSLSLSVHKCREKCFEDNCPICREYIFTSSSPVKALPCGHLMHSACFQEYTCTHYTCPICSKSLGDMQVYFGMLDALLAEEKIPEEYSGQTQVVFCNDCESRGTVSFHWLYHKCTCCGSYNTRLL